MFTPTTLLLSLLSLPSAFAANIPRHLVTRMPDNDKKVIVQMFEWSWDSVKVECASFLGPAGYGYVQVSPAMEHLTGDQWWTSYQAVSYKLQSKRGDRDQFKAMVDGCHAAGVKVIVDVLWNHMAGLDSGKGVAGSEFTHYNYPGIYSSQDFHYCGTAGNDIKNYDNQNQVENCELANLADLKTESEHVRQGLVAHGNDLLSLGVDGFRLDAAKHIAPEDITNILSRLSRHPYITQEVVDTASVAVFSNRHASAGDVQEFRYPEALASAFKNGGDGVTSLADLENRGWLSSEQANVFINNHDSERGGSSLNSESPSNTYTLANVFMLSYPYGTPTVFSGYSFSDFDVGGPNGGYGTCLGNGGVNGWLCQHRSVAISGMAGFFNVVAGTPVVNVITSGKNQLAFGRGDKGFVAINNSGGIWNAHFKTGLADGVYCDVVGGGKQAGENECSGGRVQTVVNGEVQISVPARGAIAMHVGAKL